MRSWTGPHGLPVPGLGGAPNLHVRPNTGVAEPRDDPVANHGHDYNWRRLEIVAEDRINQIYLDRLDGEVEEACYRRHISQWREEQTQIRARFRRYQQADENYIEQGIQLLEISRNASPLYQSQGTAERAALIRFIMPGSMLQEETVVTAFHPPFDILDRMAHKSRACQQSIKTATGGKPRCLSNPASPVGRA